jgi:hypothetical protein
MPAGLAVVGRAGPDKPASTAGLYHLGVAYDEVLRSPPSGAGALIVWI